MDMDFMAYGLIYCTIATLLAVAIAIALHLTIRSPRGRAVAQSGCFAVLLGPALVVAGHSFAIVPFWIAAYGVVSLPFTGSTGAEPWPGPGGWAYFFLGLAWYALTVPLPMLVLWVLLFTPALSINKRLAGRPGRQSGRTTPPGPRRASGAG
jgi:hypothetical protein